jgi:DNA-binding LacI/PurR family transcriptional regulator
MSRPPTLKDVAQIAAVTPATVSLSLRGNPRIPTATRDRILKIAADLGYEVNPLVGKVMSHVRSARSQHFRGKIAFLNQDPDREFFTSPHAMYYARGVWNGARARATELGFDLESVWVNKDGVAPSRLSATLVARGIQGVIIAPAPSARGRVRLDWDAFSVAVLSYSSPLKGFHRVFPDHHRNMRNAVRGLRHSGARRMGLIIPVGFDDRSDNQWVSCFEFYQRRSRARSPVPLLEIALPDDTAAIRWFHKYHPDAILAAAHMGIYEQFSAAGLKFPDDALFAQLDWEPDHAHCAGVEVFPEVIGATGVEAVAAQIYNGHTGRHAHPQSIAIEGEWRNGPTATRVPSTAAVGTAAAQPPQVKV